MPDMSIRLAVPTEFEPVHHLGPAALVALCAFMALLVVCGTLAVHSTETILVRRRQMASLVATGIEPSVIGQSQRAEALMATIPLALLGSLLGGLGYGLLSGGGMAPSRDWPRPSSRSVPSFSLPQ